MALSTLQLAVFWLETAVQGGVVMAAVFALLLALGILRGRKRPDATGGVKDAASALGSSAAIAFVHPDLGIGGAERLVVDAAVGLQSKGHTVVMYTSHHDASHAFVETTDGTLTVKVYGDFLPRTIFGRGHILCATLRGVYLALVLALMEPQFDLFLVDQLSAPNPILFLTGAKILFYCHFPDLKLSGARSWLKALYRGPFDWLEEWTTLLAHRILVNSHFTAKVFQETFKSAHSAPAVLYPCINLEAFDKSAQDAASQGDVDADLASALETRTCFVSINRFERKKDVGLALRAFAVVLEGLPREEAPGLRLILAGGYDPRVRENREYRLELDALATELGVSAQVIFKQSFSDAERGALLGKAVAVVYTPVNEHFGIVPIEAMYSRRPVIACNSGGPTESILDGVTGFLCEPEAEAFAGAMRRLLDDRPAAARMGEAGRERVRATFSLSAFAARLDAVIRLTLAEM